MVKRWSASAPPGLAGVGLTCALACGAAAHAGADSTPFPSDTPDIDSRRDLEWMHEEEKLARDIYLNNLDRYGLRIFANISDAEQRHMDAVKGLLDARSQSAPTMGMKRGAFAHPKLATLFADLDARSAVSVVDALRVGAEIEEIDLLDLAEQLSRNDDDDIQKTYAHLARGSRNHLRAFVRQLARRGVTYVPQHLDPKEFSEIVSDDVERGKGRRRSHRD